MNDEILDAQQEHYRAAAVPPIVVMMYVMSSDEFKGYLRGNILKYYMRAGHKEGTDDLAKKAVYVNWLTEYTYHQGIRVDGKFYMDLPLNESD